MKQYLVFLAIASFFLQSCSRNPVTGKREVMLMSESQEIQLGKDSDPSIVATYGLYENTQIQNFIQKKGKEMAAVSHRPNLNYEFKVLDSPVVNAFALPGGYVYFTRGILAHFNNEAQFAGVLGHEIGHVTARHSAKQYSKQILAQGLLVGGMIVSSDFAKYADVASQGIGLLFLKFSRDNESESDGLGVQYSTKIGYNAAEMAEFFNTLKALSDQAGSIPSFLSTHPDPADRNQNVEKYAAEVQQDLGLNPANLEINRNQYLKLIDGIVYGEDPTQGFFESNYFYHPGLKFKFPVPAGWNTANTPAMVQMAPSDGKAVILFALASGANLTDAVNKEIQDNGLTVASKNNTTVNGYPAVAVVSTQTGQASDGSQVSLKILSYFIQYNNMIYKFHGMSNAADYNAYYNYFLNTMKGFNTLTDANKLNRKPDRIKVVEAKSSGTFQSALSTYGVASTDFNELVILNDMALNAQVTKGTLFKIIERNSPQTGSNTTSPTTGGNANNGTNVPSSTTSPSNTGTNTSTNTGSNTSGTTVINKGTNTESNTTGQGSSNTNTTSPTSTNAGKPTKVVKPNNLKKSGNK